MIIKKAEYTISSPRESMCPKDTKPEFAFIGRSNVGKSSLINMLTNRKALAKTSSKPGKTLLINHFIINNEWYLVDLPGYGYAQGSSTKSSQRRLEQMIAGYILQRKQLVNLFVLIDIRHEQQRIDREFVDWLGESGVPFCIAARATHTSTCAVRAGLLIRMLNSNSWFCVLPDTPLRVKFTPCPISSSASTWMRLLRRTLQRLLLMSLLRLPRRTP